MTEPVQFIPKPDDQVMITKDILKSAAELIDPDITDERLEKAWLGFVAMKNRVENPRRRIGGDVVRCGPVLFDPVQYKNRD